MRFSPSAGNESCTWCRGHGAGWGEQGCGVWGHTGQGALWGRVEQGVGLCSVEPYGGKGMGLCGMRPRSVGSVGCPGSLCFVGGHKPCWIHITASPTQGPAQAGGITQQLWMCLATKHPSPATSSSPLCSSSPGTNPRALPSRNQPTEGVCCSLLALDTFRIGGFLFFKPHRGDSCTHRVNCNESPFSSPPAPAGPAGSPVPGYL